MGMVATATDTTQGTSMAMRMMAAMNTALAAGTITHMTTAMIMATPTRPLPRSQQRCAANH
jgi:hypothetical protein